MGFLLFLLLGIVLGAAWLRRGQKLADCQAALRHAQQQCRILQTRLADCEARQRQNADSPDNHR